jgi:hypothetical protein
MTVVTDDGTRTRDRAASEHHTNDRGAESIHRNLLFAQDGIGGLRTIPGGGPITTSIRRAGISGSMGGNSPREWRPQ